MKRRKRKKRGNPQAFPMCPKCGRPIINGLYCLWCGTFLSKKPYTKRK